MGKTNYGAVREIAEKPLSERTTVIDKRGKSSIVRRYHLTQKQLDKIDAEKKALGDVAGEVFINPYIRAGTYRGTVEALRVLGLNLWHDYPIFKSKVVEILQAIQGKGGNSVWHNFENRISEASTNRDTDGKLMHNVAVLQRLTGMHPYGEKLRQVKACIDIRYNEDGMLQYRLNTKFDNYEDVKPFNGIKKKRGRKRKSG